MLSAIDVDKRYRERWLLRHVSLRVRPGELLVLAGTNGAGKSTLLKMLSGELTPDGGEIRYGDRPAGDWPLRELAKRRAVMPQDQRLGFPFTARDVVLMGRYAHHQGCPRAADRQLARRLMASLDIGHLAQRLYPTLSGGERARVQLARALCQVLDSDTPEPPLLLLDEPTASLDLAHQQLALSVAHTFTRREGGGVCAVLHDLNLAAQYADRLAILAEQRLLAEGPPATILTEALLSRAFATQVQVIRHPALAHPLVTTARPGSAPDGHAATGQACAAHGGIEVSR